MNKPLETLYCREVIARYGDWKNQYIPIPGKLFEEKTQGVWDSTDPCLNVARCMPQTLTKCWSTGQIISQVREIPDSAEIANHLSSFALIGESGAGKSVALMRLALEQALLLLDNPGPSHLPFLIHLNRYRYHLFNRPKRFLIQHLEQQGRIGFPAHQQMASLLQERLESGQMLLLLDGLDQLPKMSQSQAIRQWQKFIRQYGDHGRGNRVIVTARHGDSVYQTGLPTITLNPLTTDSQKQCIFSQLDEENAQALWGKLQSGEYRGLREIAGNPFWLLKMIEVFKFDSHLPDSRGQILKCWIAAKGDQALSGRGSAEKSTELFQNSHLLESFEDIVLKLTCQQGDSLVIRHSRLRKSLSKLVQEEKQVNSVLLGDNSPFLESEKLLPAAQHPPDPSYWFKHDWLQAHCTAEALNRRLIAGQERSFIRRCVAPQDDNCKEGRLLRHNAFSPLPDISPKANREEVLLLTGIVSDPSYLIDRILKVNPLLAAQCILEKGIHFEEENRQAVVDALIGIISSRKHHLRSRITAGNLLGKLGDPRLSETVLIPAGQAILGTGRNIHVVDVSAFQLFKYPVTRAEFARFVTSDAYNQREWWTKAGWQWCQAFSQTNHRDVDDIIQGRPNHPATGVTWYEATAYGNWLSSQHGILYRLPSEAEWEKGARGPTNHAFPWGDNPDPAFANTCIFKSLYVFDTTPVGIYPEGIGWYGAYDQAGNVWEWCTSRYMPYPYDLHDGRETLQGDDARVLRGGSWLQPLERARCNTRSAGLPETAHPDIGFRLIQVIS